MYSLKAVHIRLNLLKITLAPNPIPILTHILNPHHAANATALLVHFPIATMLTHTINHDLLIAPLAHLLLHPVPLPPCLLRSASQLLFPRVPQRYLLQCQRQSRCLELTHLINTIIIITIIIIAVHVPLPPPYHSLLLSSQHPHPH